jgi:hypothetical protein
VPYVIMSTLTHFSRFHWNANSMTKIQFVHGARNIAGKRQVEIGSWLGSTLANIYKENDGW